MMRCLVSAVKYSSLIKLDGCINSLHCSWISLKRNLNMYSSMGYITKQHMLLVFILFFDSCLIMI